MRYAALVFLLVLLAGPHRLRAADPPAPPAKAAEEGKRQAAWVMTVPLPISGLTAERVIQFTAKAIEKAQAQGIHPLLVFEFVVPRDQKEFGRGTRFEDALKLARFLSGDRFHGAPDDLNAATTVAYVPQSIQGHAVLAVMACDKVLMAPEAELGPAGVDERTIAPTVLAGYKEIASHHKGLPEAVAIKLVDPSRTLLKARTDMDDRYLLAEDLEKLRKEQAVASTQVISGQDKPYKISGREARDLGLASRLVGARDELAGALEIPPEALVEDPLLAGGLRAIRVDLKGPIKADSVAEVQKLIREAESKDKVNFVCLWIDSPGGSPTDSMNLANFIAGLDPAQVFVVAYVPTQALSDAALVAMACHQIVVRPQATLGGEGDHVYSDDEIAMIRKALREELAPRRSRSWSLWAAMVDPNLEVFRYTREGDPRQTNYYLSADEAEKQADAPGAKGKWQRQELVTAPGKPFSADGNKAVELRLANHAVDGFPQFKQIYGLEDDPALVERSWAHVLIEALAGAAILLLIIGGAALYVEMQSPGIGIGGLIATVCFALFFWSQFLHGTAGWLEVILFVLGVAFLLLEVFVLPGFGIFGLAGVLLVVASVVLAIQTFVIPHNAYQFGQMQRSLLTLGGAMAGIIAAVVIVNHYFPRAPLLGQMVLAPPSEEEAEDLSRREALADYSDLLGMRGTTTTQLVPAGKALIANRVVNVMADGEFISRGVRVEVVEAHGTRVVVREVD